MPRRSSTPLSIYLLYFLVFQNNQCLLGTLTTTKVVKGESEIIIKHTLAKIN